MANEPRIPRYDPPLGKDFNASLESAKSEAIKRGNPVSMRFNEIDVIINPDSNLGDIAIIYGLRRDLSLVLDGGLEALARQKGMPPNWTETKDWASKMSQRVRGRSVTD